MMAYFSFATAIPGAEAILYVLIVAFVAFMLLITAQRLRDIGVSSWLALVWLPVWSLPLPLSWLAVGVFLILLCVVAGRTADGPVHTGDRS